MPGNFSVQLLLCGWQWADLLIAVITPRPDSAAQSCWFTQHILKRWRGNKDVSYYGIINLQFAKEEAVSRVVEPNRTCYYQGIGILSGHKFRKPNKSPYERLTVPPCWDWPACGRLPVVQAIFKVVVVDTSPIFHWSTSGCCVSTRYSRWNLTQNMMLEKTDTFLDANLNGTGFERNIFCSDPSSHHHSYECMNITFAGHFWNWNFYRMYVTFCLYLRHSSRLGRSVLVQISSGCSNRRFSVI